MTNSQLHLKRRDNRDHKFIWSYGVVVIILFYSFSIIIVTFFLIHPTNASTIGKSSSTPIYDNYNSRTTTVGPSSNGVEDPSPSSVRGGFFTSFSSSDDSEEYSDTDEVEIDDMDPKESMSDEEAEEEITNNEAKSLSTNKSQAIVGSNGGKTQNNPIETSTNNLSSDQPSNPLASSSLVHLQKIPKQQGGENANKSQPLRTLKKLQAMLEDTDYATETNNPEDDALWTSKDRSKYKKQQRKYTRQKEMQEEQEHLRLHMQQQQQQASSSSNGSNSSMSSDDDDDDIATDDTDDGLGYTLPNLPIYFSDTESTDSDGEAINSQPIVPKVPDSQIVPIVPDSQINSSLQPSSSMINYQNQQQQNRLHATRQQQQYTMPPPQQGQGPVYQYQSTNNLQQQPQYQPYPQQQQQQQPPPHQQPPPPPENQFPPQQPMPYNQQHQYPPYGYNNPQMYNNMQSYQSMPSQMQQQQQGQYYPPSPYTNHWPQSTITSTPQEYASHPLPNGYYPSPQQYYQFQQEQQVQRRQQAQQQQRNNPFIPQSFVRSPGRNSQPSSKKRNSLSPVENRESIDITNIQSRVDQATNIQSAPTKIINSGKFPITFDSFQKITFFSISMLLLSYCAVSPRTLDTPEYNNLWFKNIQLVSLMFYAPLMTSFIVISKKNDLNVLVSTFYTACTVGYFASFLLEITFTTIIRLGVFLLWEPSIFSLTPSIPIIVLPWTLREHKYRPKRLTLFVADLVTTCVVAPIIEEYMKLKVVQLSARLPKNYHFVKNVDKTRKNKSRNKKKKLQAIYRNPGEEDVTSINSYVSHFLMASIGLKLCDSVRRILMYTKKDDKNKEFYAFLRGIFPIQELCGTMTALQLAKRDVLGVQLPVWRILAPGVLIHGVANFRGMKPIFKWNSSTPWSEMQLAPWNGLKDQFLTKGFSKVMYLIILGRVLGYCLKNYYMISRQSVKRTTTYAGKTSAFSAELATTEMLKKNKKE